MTIIKEDITFGRIAVLNNMITQEQLEEVLAIQRKGDTLRPLGIILLERGYITKQQLHTILEVQKKRMPKPATNPQEKREDVTFAYLAVSNGYIDLETIHNCFQLQTELVRKGLLFRISELLVNHHYMAIAEVEKILDILEQRTLECPECKTRYNTIGMTCRSEFDCKKCGTILAVPQGLIRENEVEELEQFCQAMEQFAEQTQVEIEIEATTDEELCPQSPDNCESTQISPFAEGAGETKEEGEEGDDDGEEGELRESFSPFTEGVAETREEQDEQEKNLATSSDEN